MSGKFFLKQAWLIDTSINRWIAPLIGLVIGAFIGLKLAIRENQPFQWQYTLISAGIGFLAGCILLLVDRPAIGNKTFDGSSLDLPAATTTHHQGSNIGRVVFIFLILLFFFPLVGLGLGITSLILNRGWKGWPRAINWSLSALALAMTTLLFILLAFDN